MRLRHRSLRIVKEAAEAVGIPRLLSRLLQKTLPRCLPDGLCGRSKEAFGIPIL